MKTRYFLIWLLTVAIISLFYVHKRQIRNRKDLECNQAMIRMERDHKFREKQCVLAGNDYDCEVNDTVLYHKDLIELIKLFKKNGCI